MVKSKGRNTYNSRREKCRVREGYAERDKDRERVRVTGIERAMHRRETGDIDGSAIRGNPMARTDALPWVMANRKLGKDD